jgi:hypothetical protein
MKKSAFIAFAVLALFFVSSRELAAQSEVALNIGVITDKSFSFNPFLWIMGLSFDFYLTPSLSLSPEIYMAVHNSDFGTILVAPAVLLNFQGDGFFLGGGFTKWWALGSDVAGSPSSHVALKWNAGLKGGSIKLTAFVITPFDNIFQDMAVGAAFGFYF